MWLWSFSSNSSVRTFRRDRLSVLLAINEGMEKNSGRKGVALNMRLSAIPYSPVHFNDSAHSLPAFSTS